MPHQGTAWYEAAVGRLAGRLLRVANGLVPTDVEKIVDIDLTQIVRYRTYQQRTHNMSAELYLLEKESEI